MNGPLITQSANIVYDTLDLSQTGEISASAVKNLSDFMVEHDLMKPSEAPPWTRCSPIVSSNRGSVSMFPAQDR